MFKLSSKSLARLEQVDIKLAAVIRRAIELTEVDFTVTQGRRTQEYQDELYARGRTKPGKIVTWTRKSKHIEGKAVDLAPYVNGRIEWDDNGKLGLWPKIADAVKRAAKEQGVEVFWGGDWTKTIDRPHFEIK